MSFMGNSRIWALGSFARSIDEMSAGRKKVVVAMSGGVDSSVAAGLLLRQGYEVVGVFMRLGTPAGVEGLDAEEACERPSGKQGCCSVRDAQDARRVAGLLGIPFYVLNFQDEFGKVIDYFVAEYNAGRTPNPCVRCNDWLKFGKLAQYARAVGADYVASGHYARIGDRGGQSILMRGTDTKKDQSYVLFGISAEHLQRTLFPVGELEKAQVRAIAEELKLPVFDKPDSQEICFVPDDDYAALVHRRSPEALRPGEFVDTSGKTLGHHEGHQNFTVGQRKGLRIALGARAYVTEIDAQSNRVTLGTKQDLLKVNLAAKDLNITHPEVRVGEEIACQVKVRYNQQPQPAVMTIDNGEMRVRFEQAQSAITPGQAAVAYQGEELLGGGWIEKAW
jgi:tRNA-uridine 2-sulfurtransferase